MGMSKIEALILIRLIAVCPATNIMMITHKKLIMALFQSKRYFKYNPIKESCTIIRAKAIIDDLKSPVLNFEMKYIGMTSNNSPTNRLM